MSMEPGAGTDQQGLEPVAQPEQGAGFALKCLTRTPLTPQWFTTAVTLLQKKLSSQLTFTGRFTAAGSQAPEIRGDVESWKRAILAAWDQTVHVYGWFYSPAMTLRLELDTLREQVELEVQAQTRAESESIFQALARELSLEVIREFPFPAARSAGIFEVGVLPHEKFAEAVHSAIESFVSPRPAIEEAMIVEGESKDRRSLQHYSSFSAFVQRLRDAEPYVEANIFVHGPRGAALRIHLYSPEDKEVLELRSSMRAEQFHELVKVFRPLRLKRLAEKEAPPKAGQEPRRTESPWLKVLIALIALFAGSMIDVAQAAFPRHELQLTVPPATKDNAPYILQGGVLPVEWVLRTEQWFQKRDDRGSPATVRILRDGLYLLEEMPGQRPGMRVNLAPGYYTLEVIAPQAQGVSDKRFIRVLP